MTTKTAAAITPDSVLGLADAPDLHAYRWLVANISGGKDSQTMLRRLIAEASRQGYPRERIVAVFADLGSRDEWLSTADMDAINGTALAGLYGDRPGAGELARQHAEHYGLRFEVTKRLAVQADGTKAEQDLIDHIEDRGMWPSPGQRYCTSDGKRGPIGRVYTQLAGEARHDGHDGPVRILSVQGMRGEESPARALLKPFRRDERATGKGQAKVVDIWLPIHDWTAVRVWADIRKSKVPYSWVYDARMPRLSCRFCVLAGKHALARAAQLDPAGARERAAMEDRMGHTLRKGQSFRDVIALAESGQELNVTDWGEGGAAACTAA